MQNSPLQLEAYYVKEMSFSLAPGLEGKLQFSAQPGLHIQAKNTVSVDPPDLEINVVGGHHENDSLRWRFELSVELKKVEPKKKFPYTFRVVLCGFFRVSDQYPADRVELLAATNAPSLLYSSARELLATVTGRGPCPAVILPSMLFLKAPATQAIPAQLAEPAKSAESGKIKVELAGLQAAKKPSERRKREIQKKGEKMAKNEKTSKKVASMASKLLRSKRTSKAVKSVAASVLTQRPDRKSKRR